MKNNKIRIISYMALYAALYVVLKFAGQYIPFLQMPQGGSIELELTAVFIASYHMGWKYGILTAMIGFLLTFICGFPIYWLNLGQFMLDYILPLLFVGASSLLGRNGSVRQIIGISLAMILKYISQLLSGVYYWPPEGSVAGSKAAWIYSAGYNLWYNLATLVVCIILVPLLLKRLEKTSAWKQFAK
ncbi:MAG: energy-coupled thiamine transporter ThiT [Lactimicrobium massiliense]|nr:ECF transporter S component [Lactimicrobium massiliense]MDD6675761.1 energy-coupled thiamine transporter ThiT [Lactimicrobium massiliense]